MSVTVHSLVRNEDQFIWFSLMSVLPFVNQVLVYDTGSTDKTVEIIKSIRSNRIVFEEKGVVAPEGLVGLRQEMIDKTETDFFMLLDGDEIWPRANIEKFLKDMEGMSSEKISVYCRTRNAVGDIYHYLPESAGAYQFQGKRGHFAMRGFRNAPDFTVSGIYPLETYRYQGRSLNDWDEKLLFSDTWYLHVTHLKRSSSSVEVPGLRLEKIEKGLSLEQVPEVFQNRLSPRRSRWYELAASLVTPLKEIKRKYAPV